MSGLAGVRWHDDNRAARVRDVASVVKQLEHRGPDGLFAHASGPAALGIAHQITTPEARAERQPFVSTCGLVVTLDGRIDNTNELRAALAISRVATPSDVSVVAAAWERWAADALPRLLGDFALVVWDTRTRELFLARDVFGLRPLLYRQHGDGLWWASELQALARLGDARANLGVAAEYLIDSIRTETETLVEGVYRIPRASVLICSAPGALHVQRYWEPSIERSPSPRDDREVVEEFRALFAQAVRARLRSDRPVAILLSGGLDSSLVAAESAAFARVAKRPAVSSFTLAAPGDASDESPYASAVAEYLSLPSTLCAYQEAELGPIVADAHRSLEMPMAPNCVAALPLTSALHAGHVRVCLNGVGGNEWFSGNHFPFADQLRQLQFTRMVSRMRAYRQADPSYRPYADLRLALWLQLPESARQLLRRFMPSGSPAWIAPEFAKCMSLADRVQMRLDVPKFHTIQQRLMFGWSTSANNMFFTEYTERVNAWLACEERMPFLDRRLVEWALALPDEQRWRDGVGKVVLRHAAAPLLPSAIVRRERGPDFSHQTSQGLHRIGGRDLVMSIAHERREWVVPQAIGSLWDAMCEAERPGGRRLGYYAWLLWLLVGTHLAVRAIETCSVDRIESLAVPQETVA